MLKKNQHKVGARLPNNLKRLFQLGKCFSTGMIIRVNLMLSQSKRLALSYIEREAITAFANDC